MIKEKASDSRAEEGSGQKRSWLGGEIETKPTTPKLDHRKVALSKVNL